MNDTAVRIITALATLEEEGKLKLNEVEVEKVENYTYYLHNNRVKMIVEWEGHTAKIL